MIFEQCPMELASAMARFPHDRLQTGLPLTSRNGIAEGLKPGTTCISSRRIEPESDLDSGENPEKQRQNSSCEAHLNSCMFVVLKNPAGQSV